MSPYPPTRHGRKGAGEPPVVGVRRKTKKPDTTGRLRQKTTRQGSVGQNTPTRDISRTDDRSPNPGSFSSQLSIKARLLGNDRAAAARFATEPDTDFRRAEA
jgi:hypothetical protein